MLSDQQFNILSNVAVYALKKKTFLFRKIKQKRNNNWFEIDLVSATYTRTCKVKPV